MASWILVAVVVVLVVDGVVVEKAVEDVTRWVQCLGLLVVRTACDLIQQK